MTQGNDATPLWERSRALAERFMESPLHVQLDEAAIQQMSAEVRMLPAPEPWGLPIFASRSLTEEEMIVYEMMSCAVDYCFWYGLPYIRPNGASAIRMNELLNQAFEAWMTGDQPNFLGRPNLSAKGRLLRHFVSLMAENQFPVMVDRTRHLLELEPVIDLLPERILESVGRHDSLPCLDELFRTLVQSCPGYAEDPFFKRALLFFMQLNRRVGWFEAEIRHLPIPADYQIPRVLRYQGVIRYSDELAGAVDRFALILPGSSEECEIRAASILACDMIAELSGWKTSDVDYYCWTIRNTCKAPFHLTVTPNY